MQLVADRDLYDGSDRKEKPLSARYIELTRGFRALVDEEDFERVCLHKWYAAVQEDYVYGYNRTIGALHRFILGARDGLLVDHVNGDTLDNRRANLRECTRSQNAANQTRKNASNTSGFHGVSWHKHAGQWHAQIRFNRKSVSLGYFRDPIEAAQAYDRKAIELFGEFACLNFPQASDE